MPKKLLADLNEIEKKIRAGALDGVKVVAQGTANKVESRFLTDLIRGKYGGLHPRGLEIEGFTIQGVLDLEYCIIHSGLSFIECCFPDSINLFDARLAGFVLENCLVDGGLKAERVQISGSMFVRKDSVVNGSLTLPLAEIRGNLDLSGAKITASASQDPDKPFYAIFADGLHVNGNVLFCKSFEANGGIKMMGGRIDGNLDCEGGTFKQQGSGHAFYGDGLTVKGSVKLNGTFEGEKGLSLLCADLGRILDMKGGAFKGAVNLMHAKTVTLCDNVACWKRMTKLEIDGFRYEYLDPEAPSSFIKRRQWLEIATKKVFVPQPYEQLAKVQALMGLLGEVRITQMAKEKGMRGTIGRFRPRWLLSCLSQGFIGFGYAPWRVFYWLLGVWIFGIIVFWGADERSIIVPAKERIYMSVGCEAPEATKCDRGVNGSTPVNLTNITEAYPKFNAALYSLDTLLPFVDLKQEEYWLPAVNQKTGAGDFAHAYLWFHIGIGWLFASLGVAAITGLVKKDN